MEQTSSHHCGERYLLPVQIQVMADHRLQSAVHQADVFLGVQIVFPTAEFLVALSLTAFEQHQASSLEDFVTIHCSYGDRSLGEIQLAESLISCSQSQKLFDVSLSKKKKKL